MPNAMVPLANVTLNTAATTVTFSSIPQTGFIDLVLVCDILSSGGSTSYGNAGIRFNGVATLDHAYQLRRGNVTSASAANNTNVSTIPFGVGTASSNAFLRGGTRSNALVTIFDYSRTNPQKTAIYQASNANIVTISGAGRNNSTAAVTSLSIVRTDGSMSFSAGSTFALYGIEG